MAEAMRNQAAEGQGNGPEQSREETKAATGVVEPDHIGPDIGRQKNIARILAAPRRVKRGHNGERPRGVEKIFEKYQRQVGKVNDPLRDAADSLMVTPIE